MPATDNPSSSSTGRPGSSPRTPSSSNWLAGYHVYAPELPGYGESLGEDYLEDMLDFTLHTWDVIDELGLAGDHPHVIGHSMGGMIAAEMASVNPHQVGKLVLVGAAGLWLEEDPIPDMFSFLPFEFAEYLFHDPSKAAHP